MADIENFYDDLIIINLYFTIFFQVEAEVESKIEELIQEAEKLEPVTDIAKNAMNPLMSFHLYPPEKCRHEIGLYKVKNNQFV